MKSSYSGLFLASDPAADADDFPPVIFFALATLTAPPTAVRRRLMPPPEDVTMAGRLVGGMVIYYG